MRISHWFLFVFVSACSPPIPADETKNSFLVTVSGEAAATEGHAFPAGQSGAPSFVDGWEVVYEHVLLTVGEVSLSENPDLSVNDQSLTGPVVARTAGPWAVDLSLPGPLDAKGGEGQAWPLTRLSRQTEKPGTPAFDPTAKYALGFALVSADVNAQLVNLDADGKAAYATMVARGWTVLLEGTATWKGGTCRTSDASYDFARFPKKVRFSFGFAAPVHFRNCINPELPGGEARGVQSSVNTQTITQLTFHLDHPFWEALEEDAPLRFDALAARRSIATGAGLPVADVNTDDLSLDFQAPHDAQGAPIPWRTCGPAQPGERTSGSVAYDPVNVPVSPSGGAAGLKNLGEYMTYNLSTFGHLNADGLCFPERQFAAPK